MNNTLAFLARCLLAAIFIVSGVRKALAFAGVAGMMGSKGFPMPEVFLAGAIALDIIGGFLLIANWNAKPVAAVMAAYTLVLAVVFHGFWHAPAPQFANELNHFLKNIAIAGGLLLVASMPARDTET